MNVAIACTRLSVCADTLLLLAAVAPELPVGARLDTVKPPEPKVWYSCVAEISNVPSYDAFGEEAPQGFEKM